MRCYIISHSALELLPEALGLMTAGRGYPGAGTISGWDNGLRFGGRCIPNTEQSGWTATQEPPSGPTRIKVPPGTIITPLRARRILARSRDP